MIMNKTSSRYTYADFAAEVISIVKGDTEITDAVRDRVIEKALALSLAQANKAAYNAAHPKAGKAKGASAETQAKADAIKGILTDDPMTAAEINAALGTDYTALQVANAAKYIDGIRSTKVIRPFVNGKGLRSEKEYTAYFIG